MLYALLKLLFKVTLPSFGDESPWSGLVSWCRGDNAKFNLLTSSGGLRTSGGPIPGINADQTTSVVVDYAALAALQESCPLTPRASTSFKTEKWPVGGVVLLSNVSRGTSMLRPPVQLVNRAPVFAAFHKLAPLEPKPIGG